MSRQVLVQRLLLPSNGSVNPTGHLHTNSTQTLTPNTSATLSSNVTATNYKEVPWNQANKYRPQTTTATTITTTTTSDQNPQNHNATFLDALTLNQFEEMPQTSTSQYQQQHKDLLDQNEDKIYGLSSGISSVDSAFDESSSRFCSFTKQTFFCNF